jgi:hypothetical protein
MVEEWARLQDDYAHKHKIRGTDAGTPPTTHTTQQDIRARNGTQWTGEIIVTLWERWYIVWTMRNMAIHGHDQETKARQLRKNDLHRLQSIYDQKHMLEPSMQELLFTSIEEHQQQRGSTAIHNWLSIHETTFIQSVKQATKRAIQGVRSLKTYFPVHTHLKFTNKPNNATTTDPPFYRTLPQVDPRHYTPPLPKSLTRFTTYSINSVSCLTAKLSGGPCGSGFPQTGELSYSTLK